MERDFGRVDALYWAETEAEDVEGCEEVADTWYSMWWVLSAKSGSGNREWNCLQLVVSATHAVYSYHSWNYASSFHKDRIENCSVEDNGTNLQLSSMKARFKFLQISPEAAMQRSA
jgi:hypothetical protein